MPIFKKLITETNNINALKTYLSDNFTTVHDFFTLQKHSNLLDLKAEYKVLLDINDQSEVKQSEKF